jgi:hypothetical protein
MEERILAQHPDPGKQGVRISRAKYDVVRAAILDALHTEGALGFDGLTRAVETRLAGGFDGSVSWYVTTVKLDLEARGEIERAPGLGPQQIRLRAV